MEYVKLVRRTAWSPLHVECEMSRPQRQSVDGVRGRRWGLRVVLVRRRAVLCRMSRSRARGQ